PGGGPIEVQGRQQRDHPAAETRGGQVGPRAATILMIARIIEFSVRNRLLVLLLTCFVVAAGIWATIHIGLDAIPDLSDVQVIIVTDYPGQAPDVVENQVTYPLTTKMMGIPRARLVRGQSMFELSFVYVIFEDGTDLYWARSRVLE